MLPSSQLSLQEDREGSSALSACLAVLELPLRFALIALGVLWGSACSELGLCQPGAECDKTLVLPACLTLAEVVYMVTVSGFCDAARASLLEAAGPVVPAL